MEKLKRYFFLDIVRGFLIILVVLFHLIYDLDMYNIINFNLSIPLFEAGKAVVVALFCIISGISINLSRNSLKRALTLIFFAYLVTLTTYFFNKEMYDLFGILHCLGFCALIYALLKKPIDGFSKYKFAPLVFLILFVALRLVPMPYVSIPHLYMLGFIQADFASLDYYPLIPWLFAFLLGTSLTGYVTQMRLPERIYSVRSKQLEFLGRHSLIVYLVHQPIFLAIIMLIK